MSGLIPLLAIAVSVVYFRRSPKDQSLSQRLLVSAHGVAIAALHICALIVMWSGSSHKALGQPYAFAPLIPVLLIAVSFLKFRGPRTVISIRIATSRVAPIALFHCVIGHELSGYR
jgi:hypothetical protein